MSVCLEGVQLTVKQIKHLLEELGAHFEKNLKKNQLQILLIKSCLQEGEEQENAIAKISEATEGEDGGPDLEEVLEALGEDEANYQEVKKLRQQEGRKGKKKGGDEALPVKPKAKAKAGRGKGRGKGKGKGKGRPNFVAKVKKFILKKGQESHESKAQEKKEPADEAILSEEPAVGGGGGGTFQQQCKAQSGASSGCRWGGGTFQPGFGQALGEGKGTT